MSSGLVDANGASLSTDAPAFEPGTYVYYKGTCIEGQIHGRDVFLVVDPSWVGQPPIIGKTMVICGMPYYDRTKEDNGQGRVPAMMTDLDFQSSVPMESLPPHEREFLEQGGVIADPTRFRYRLLVVNPMTFWIDSSDLFVVEPHHHVVIMSSMKRHDLPVTLPTPQDNNGNSASIYNLDPSATLSGDSSEGQQHHSDDAE